MRRLAITQSAVALARQLATTFMVVGVESPKIAMVAAIGIGQLVMQVPERAVALVSIESPRNVADFIPQRVTRLLETAAEALLFRAELTVELANRDFELVEIVATAYMSRLCRWAGSPK